MVELLNGLIMRKIYYIATAIATLSLFASCNKEQIVSTDKNAGKVTVEIKVADLTPDTKAIKTDWANGDKINIWFKDVASPNYSYWKQKPHLVLTRSNGTWVSSEVDEALLKASGSFDAVYESSNTLFNNVIDNDRAHFPTGTPFKINGQSSNTKTRQTPLVCVKTNVSYAYNSGTKKITGSFSGWDFRTHIQVVVSGRSFTADRYALTFDSIDNNNGVYRVECMYYWNGNISTSEESACNGLGTDKWNEGLANSDGIAFYFKSASNSEQTYTIYLADKVEKKIYSYTKTATITSSYTQCTGIKIDFSKFTQVGNIE